MKIFIQEFATSGGLTKETFQPSLLVEGFGMLRKLIRNFTRLKYEVVTTIDSRISFLTSFLDTNSIALIDNPLKMTSTSKAILDECDYFLIVAPGTEGILKEMVQEYEKSGVESLNCRANAINFSTKKSEIYKHCEKKGLLYPESHLFESQKRVLSLLTNKEEKIDSLEQFVKEKDFHFPLIWKPDEGEACENVRLLNNFQDLSNQFVTKPSGNYLIQNYIEGEHLSITILVRENQISILSINKQNISLGANYSEYKGGVSNIQHQMKEQLIEFSVELLSHIEGLNGLIGIDVIIKRKNNQKEIYCIEINPRATTPICGLINKQNPTIDFINPKKSERFIVNNFNTCFFSKELLELNKKIDLYSMQKLSNNDSIITPPLLLSENNYIFMGQGCSNNARKAEENYRANINTLKKRLIV